MIARVLLPLPVEHTFDFEVGDSLLEKLSIGTRVTVRFRGKDKTGIIQSLEEGSNYAGPLEPVLRVNKGPSYDPSTLSFCLDTAKYYLSPPGPFVNRLLPHTVTTRRERHVQLTGSLPYITSKIEALSRRAPRQSEVLSFLLSTQHGASEQTLRKRLKISTSVIDRLIELGLIKETREAPSLPDPATTQDLPTLTQDPVLQEDTLLMSHDRISYYVEALKYTISIKRSALILLPEILLARKMSSGLARLLGVETTLYHSGLPEGERGRIWQLVKGNPCVVVGTRSSLFLPFTDLGLVIVDQEHDRSYKQDEMTPYFNARDVVKRKGGHRVILGSPSPSVESFHQSRQGKIKLVRKPALQTDVMLVDMRKEKAPLSNVLIEGIAETIASGKRVLLGVNARGHFQAVLCKECGKPLVCPNCGANLTYDVRSSQLVCRVCGVAQPRMACPNCGSRSLRFVGIGSQRLEEEMNARFPGMQIARIDRSSLSNKASLAEAELAIEEKAQIIIGTPLATKGPTIDNLGLVATIGLDGIIARPDFRAAERTYQYLVGLFARLDRKGKAIIQTSYPEHYAVTAAVTADYDLFYEREIKDREAMFYPPFSHLARLIMPKDTAPKKLIADLNTDDVRVVGPAPRPGKHSQEMILVKAKDIDILRQTCMDIRKSTASRTKVEIDIDPDQI